MATIPEFKDKFFEGEPGLLAVFDYEYDEIIDFYQRLRWMQWMASSLSMPNGSFFVACHAVTKEKSQRRSPMTKSRIVMFRNPFDTNLFRSFLRSYALVITRCHALA